MNNNSFLACHGSSIREMRFVLVIRHSPTLLAVCNQLVRVLLSVLRGGIRIRLGRIQDMDWVESMIIPIKLCGRHYLMSLQNPRMLAL